MNTPSYAPLEPHQHYIINIFSIFCLSFLIIFLLINLPLYNYTFFNIYLLLPFYLPASLYLNLTISPSLHLLFILTILLPISFTIKFCYFLFHSIHTLLTQKGEYSLSLSLSLSLCVCVCVCVLFFDGYFILCIDEFLYLTLL